MKQHFLVSAISLLVEIENSFERKTFLLVDNWFSGLSKQFFCTFFEDPCHFCPSSEKVFFKKNPYFWLKETDFRANIGFHKQKKAVNKKILFPLDTNFNSTSQNKRFLKKYKFPLREKAAFTGRNI